MTSMRSSTNARITLDGDEDRRVEVGQRPGMDKVSIPGRDGESTTATSASGTAKALVKGLAIVEVVSAADGPVRLGDLIGASGLPRPTALRAKTPNTIVDPDQLAAEMDTTRARVCDRQRGERGRRPLRRGAHPRSRRRGDRRALRVRAGLPVRG
jgi:hypothetical protein